MARPITVLASTYLFALLGLLLGHLALRAQAETGAGGGRIFAQDLLVSYALALALAGAVGLVLAAAAVKLFGGPHR